MATKPAAPKQDETPLPVMTLEQAIEQVKKLSQQVESLEKRDEGWLIFTPNVMFDGMTAGVQFTDGTAFIRKDTVYPRYVLNLPPANQLKAMSPEDALALRETVAVPSSQRLVEYLTNEYSYKSEYFDRDHQTELKSRMTQRAQERADTQAKMGNARERLEKTMLAHRV